MFLKTEVAFYTFNCHCVLIFIIFYWLLLFLYFLLHELAFLLTEGPYIWIIRARIWGKNSRDHRACGSKCSPDSNIFTELSICHKLKMFSLYTGVLSAQYSHVPLNLSYIFGGWCKLHQCYTNISVANLSMWRYALMWFYH